MRRPAHVLKTFPLVMLLLGGAASAQESGEANVLLTVESVELAFPRMDGPPTLLLVTQRGKLRPAAGTYRSQDRRILVVRDGRIIELSDPAAEDRRLRVASVDEVALRAPFAPKRLFLKDSRGQAVALPDGRFTSESGGTLVVRGGTIVAYGPGR